MRFDMATSPLLTDLYQLNMLQAYLDHGKLESAVFEFFVRKLPPQRGFLTAAGLEQVLEFLEKLRFGPPELDWLVQTQRFGRQFIDYLAGLRFTGNVHAMPEGTVFFPDEPILRVTAPLPEAQLVESRIINILHFQSLIASKAARMVLAAPSRQLIDFGLRRAHGAEAGVLAARASYLAGFAGSATTLAGAMFDIPIFGTMAHSFVQAHDSEIEAFANFARSRPEGVVLLIDTYDTEEGARKVVSLAPRLLNERIGVSGVRLDSGDLVDLSFKVRRILDEGGQGNLKIFASGGIDEGLIERAVQSGAPIDGFGVGTSLTTSADLPALDCAYKLQEYAGLARRKRSTGKATWPGRKQVWRQLNAAGFMAGDVLSLEEDRREGMPLIIPVMRKGQRVSPPEPLGSIRAQAFEQLRRLPPRLRELVPGARYAVSVSPTVQELADEVDRRTGGKAR